MFFQNLSPNPKKTTDRHRPARPEQGREQEGRRSRRLQGCVSVSLNGKRRRARERKRQTDKKNSFSPKKTQKLKTQNSPLFIYSTGGDGRVDAATSLQPYDDVFSLARFRENELIHGRWAMLGEEIYKVFGFFSFFFDFRFSISSSAFFFSRPSSAFLSSSLPLFRLSCISNKTKTKHQNTKTINKQPRSARSSPRPPPASRGPTPPRPSSTPPPTSVSRSLSPPRPWPTSTRC